MNIFPIMVVLFLSAHAFAVSGPVGSTGYLVDYRDSVIIDKHGIKKMVSSYHASGRTIFVPLNTASEWSSFVSKSHSQVLVENVRSVYGSCDLGFFG